jgi:predicted nucleic acid-binding protein
LDTVALFAAADAADAQHARATRHLADLRRVGFVVAGFAMLEFDVVLKSRGLTYDQRMEKHALVMRDFPAAASRVGTITPQVLYLTARLEKESQLEYFDAGVAAEALQHDGVIISTDRAFEKVTGLQRVW